MTNKARQLYDQGFSARANAIAHNRINATNGKIEQRLGKKGPFTEEFKDIVRSNYLGIYEHPYLDRELKGAKMILRSLQKDKRNDEAQALFGRMTKYPVERNEPCLLCPIWRHEHATKNFVALALRYFFEAVRRELFFTTVVFGYAQDLFELEELVERTRREIDSLHRQMTKRRKGLVLTGALEPDLRSPSELATMPLLRSVSREQQWNVADHGGWVLSGHFLTRAPHHDVFGELAREIWPSGSPSRVELKPLWKNKSIEASIIDAANYVIKYTGPLFDRSGDHRTYSGSAQTFRALQNAFFDPSIDKYKPVPPEFGRDAALRQWALFVDRLGADKLVYSVETVHAQKWYSESEMEYFKKAGDDAWVHGWHRIELHRDTGTYSQTAPANKQHLVPRRITRPLTIDHAWMERTDLTGVDPFTNAVSIPL